MLLGTKIFCVRKKRNKTKPKKLNENLVILYVNENAQFLQLWVWTWWQARSNERPQVQTVVPNFRLSPKGAGVLWEAAGSK